MKSFKSKLNLVEQNVYVGRIHKNPVVYKGFYWFEDNKCHLHQFEYLKPKNHTSGYGQTEEQAARETYFLDYAATILFKNDL